MRAVIGAAVIAACTVLAGCGGGDGSPVTVTVTEPGDPSASASAAAPSWTMPDLIGGNLQDAQNAIQSLTGYRKFYSGSTDLTGQDRRQILDRNWQVCTSTPPPGETFTEDTAIDFGVVRIDGESCP